MKKPTLIFLLLLLICGPAAEASYRIKSDIAADSAYADSVIKITSARLNRLIGTFTPDSLRIYIVNSEQRFDSLAGNTIPDWGAAVAIPVRHLIVIKSPLILTGDKSLGELVAHEFAHIALAQAVASRRVPRWIDEGLAMYTSAEWGWGDNLAIAWAVVIGGTVPLYQIERLNRFQGNKVRVAYSESFLAFKYFIDTYGVSGLDILLSSIRNGRSWDYSFIAATGADYASFEREFTTYLHGRYNLLTLIFDSSLLWILLALIVVVGFILTRVKRKKRMDQFDEYDKYHSTDFDYGEVEEPDEDKPWD